MSLTNSTEDRALALLGTGISPEIVASAVGVSVSRISQLVSDPEFAARVSELRFQNLQKNNLRDDRYDSLEDSVLERMESLMPMIYDPMKLIKIMQVANAAKRRGASTPDSILGQKEVVNLTMPTVLLQQFNQSFVTNVHNQVIKAGDQDLVTVQSVRMNGLLDAHRAKRLENSNVSQSPPNIPIPANISENL